MSRYPNSHYYRLAIIASDEAREALSTAFLVDSDYINQTLTGARCVTIEQLVDVSHSDSYRRYNLYLEFYNPDRIRAGQDFINDGADATLFALAMSTTETASAVVDGCTPHCLPAEQRLGIRVIPPTNEEQVACFEYITLDNQICFDAKTLNTDAFLKELIEKLNSMRLDNEAQAVAYRALEASETPSSETRKRSFSVSQALASLFRLPAVPNSSTTHAGTEAGPTTQHPAAPN